MSGLSSDGLFGALFGRGGVDASDAAWLQAMLDTEAALARAAERAGLVPVGAGAVVTSAASTDLVDPADLGRSAAGTGNPVPALVRKLTELVIASSPPAGAAVHPGATSQDIIDTAAMLIARRALGVILADLGAAACAAAELARSHAAAVMAGRTLLQQAVPITFGLVAAGWLTAIDDNRENVCRVRSDRLAVQFGGAAGTLAPLGDLGPRVMDELAAELGLAVPVLPWHTDRSRIIDLAAALAGTCAALGKIARDVTLLAQSEVAEVQEGVGGGSSAMPHKQNPVASIVVLGCAKRAPGLLATLAAAAEQEHQRAAGGWHAEWETLSDLLRLTGSAAAWAADLLGGLRIDPARMRANLDAAGGLPLAENVATRLAPAVGRIAAHDLVARATRRMAEGMGLADAVVIEAGLVGVGIERSEIEDALRPESYLGATAEFLARALAVHAGRDAALAGRDTALADRDAS